MLYTIDLIMLGGGPRPHGRGAELHRAGGPRGDLVPVSIQF